MKINNHSELVFSVLSYAIRMLEAGNEAGLLQMGFLAQEIRAIECLSLKQLKHLSELGAHFMDLRIDHACLERVIANVERDAAADRRRDDLLIAGAPVALMSHYFGMTASDCAVRRRILEIDTPTGRPPKLSDEDLEKLWAVWQATQGVGDECARLLKLAAETGFSLATIWPVTEEWKALACQPIPALRRNRVVAQGVQPVASGPSPAGESSGRGHYAARPPPPR